MTRIERRVLLNCVLAGALFTGLVVIVELSGWLQVSENWMYDLRARHFQFFSKPPTDQLVHLDIDDKSLDPSGIGYWPWPRSKMAAMVDELHRAGAKAVGMDILFAEAQPPSYETATVDGAPHIIRTIDHDALFTDAIHRAGNVLLPASFTLDSRDADALYDAVLQQLNSDIELTEQEVADRLHGQFAHDPTFENRLPNVFLPARREAVYHRIQFEMTAAALTREQLRQKLIKRRDASVNSPLSRSIDEQWERYAATSQIMRFGITPPPRTEPFLASNLNVPPLARFGSAGAATAFVDFKTSRDGVLRWQPLLTDSDGKLFPQFGFSLALLYLGATERDIEITPSDIFINCPDGRRIDVPVSTIYSDTLARNVPAIFQIPWFGNRDWETMYDWPDYRSSKGHLSMNAVWEPVLTEQKIIRTNVTADRAIRLVYKYLGIAMPPALADDDVTDRVAMIDRAFSEGKDFLDPVVASKPEDLDDDGKMIRQAVEDLRIIRRENLDQQAQLLSLRTALKQTLSGKAVMIGWTATGHQDAVPTSLHAACPGAVTHGVIFNAIVTGRFWRVGPEWITIAFTVALGWVTAVIAWRFSPLEAFLITSAFGICYVALNGLFFFNHLGLIVGLAAPQFAMATVWSGCSLSRIIVESSERARITRRFRAYVDPTLVHYVLERPDEVRLEGETRELTVCFSDMAGFTSLSEKLGEGVVPLLNEFMSLMVPIIRAQRGYVDKFLGDGIMYFFGAPLPNDNHAVDAISTAVLMQQALLRFNEELLQRGLPTVSVRIGINSGLMVVGDAGSKDAADYTVLGDNVNLASRLESANKQLGTSILLSARTAELAGRQFLLRPIGSLQVVGKTEGVPTFTVVGTLNDASSRELKLCELSRNMVNAFRTRKFAETMAIAEEIDQTFGTSVLTRTYLALSTQCIAAPPDDTFDGTIVLSEK